MCITFLLQFSKSFMAHYCVSKMCADFASLCQNMFITLIILTKIMFQQVQAICETWHMCELAISHYTYNISAIIVPGKEPWGTGIDLMLIWSWSSDWSLCYSQRCKNSYLICRSYYQLRSEVTRQNINAENNLPVCLYFACFGSRVWVSSRVWLSRVWLTGWKAVL